MLHLSICRNLWDPFLTEINKNEELNGEQAIESIICVRMWLKICPSGLQFIITLNAKGLYSGLVFLSHNHPSLYIIA